MEQVPINTNSKPKKGLLITLVILSVIFFLGCTVLGYLYYIKYNAYKNLTNENQNLTSGQKTANEKLQKQLATANKDKTTLQKENKNLEDESAAKTGKINQAKTYNDFFKYLNQVVAAHPDFTGFTQAEYEEGRTLAQATGNNDFVDTVDAAWNNTEVDPATRMISVWQAIAAGIENSLK